MGSIFKPSTTVVQAPQQSSTSYDIPEYFKEIQELERNLIAFYSSGSSDVKAYSEILKKYQEVQMESREFDPCPAPCQLQNLIELPSRTQRKI